MPESPAEPVTLRCADCGLPFARVLDGELVIESQHHGKKHRNAVSLATLCELLRKAEAEGLTTPAQVG